MGASNSSSGSGSGAGAAGDFGSALMNNIWGDIRGHRNFRRQRDLMNLQFTNQQALNKQNFDFQTMMFDKANKYNTPENQMKRLVQAGLNPALMYGQSGTGGSTAQQQSGGSGGSASGGNAPSENPLQQMNIGSTMASIKEANSRAELNKALAKKAETDAKDVEDTKDARIDELVANATDKYSKARLSNLQSNMQEIDNSYQPYMLEQLYDRNNEEIRQLQANNYITEESADSLIMENQQKAIGQTLENVLTKSKTRLTEAEINEIKASVEQKWEALDIQWSNLNEQSKRNAISELAEEIKAEYPNIMNLVGKSAQDMGIALKQGWEDLLLGKELNEDFEPRDYYNKKGAYERYKSRRDKGYNWRGATGQW